jgi:ribosomal protein S18 acetylase RimI-like enzyme
VGILVLSRDAEPEHGPRPLDIMRDLDDIGRLINIAFADDLLRDGAAVRRDLALLTAASPLVWGLRLISPEMRDAFDGFVWVEDGGIVGNITLTRDDPARRVWTISNVAVHPSHRRRGIARRLMLMALDAVQQRGGGAVVLEVKHNNDAAYKLYTDLGFAFVDGTILATHSGPVAHPVTAGPAVRRLPAGEWTKLFDLATAAQSAAALSIAPVRAAAFRPSLYDRLSAALEARLWQRERFTLAMDDGSRLGAAASVRTGNTAAFDVIIHPDRRGQIDEAIVGAALHACARPQGRTTALLNSADEAAWRFLQSVGFEETRYLHRLVLDVKA